jgi:hypothetical protein
MSGSSMSCTLTPQITPVMSDEAGFSSASAKNVSKDYSAAI